MKNCQIKIFCFDLPELSEPSISRHGTFIPFPAIAESGSSAFSEGEFMGKSIQFILVRTMPAIRQNLQWPIFLYDNGSRSIARKHPFEICIILIVMKR